MSLETPLTFTLDGAELIGIVHTPDEPVREGVLIVVGGPQYRIGAHRQFVHLARSLAAKGIAAMRFDYRGMGDSEGDFKGFEHISDDIDAALAAFRQAVPSLRSITLWGLCDAASAIVMKPDLPEEVTGLVLLNPWIRTAAGEARTYVRHYYLRRLMSAEFWKKLISGGLRAGQSLKGLKDNLQQSRQAEKGGLPERVMAGLRASRRPVLLILSGNDLVAREFEDGSGSLVRSGLPSLTVARVPAADHTFSRQAWKEEVAGLTADWISKPAQADG